IVAGLLVHIDWLDADGAEPSNEPASRLTLPVAARLDDILRRNSSPLEQTRPISQRSIGTCRDFALLLCGILPAKGVPARVRCGFASYLASGWEDHWLCEYYDRESSAWRLADAQLDDVMQHRLGIDVDAASLSRDLFKTGGEAWVSCSKG